MCRGYITRGTIYHIGTKFIGSGYNVAYSREGTVTAFKRKADERGTPFVEVDQTVSDYIKEHGDPCVKEMFSRFIKEDGEIIALFPFKRLANSIMLGGFLGHPFDPEKEKASNQNLRRGLITLKDRIMELVDKSNPKAVRKAEHYIAALNVQLDLCEENEKLINSIASSYAKWD